MIPLKLTCPFLNETRLVKARFRTALGGCILFDSYKSCGEICLIRLRLVGHYGTQKDKIKNL
jgi:hypothetical protein